MDKETARVQNNDTALRPTEWDGYIGQGAIKDLLHISIQAAKKRNGNLEHVLLHGLAGIGKTTLANILAKEMGMFMQTTAGPMLERPGDVVALLSSLEKPSVLFIDEIHRLPKTVEETLYPIMESGALDIMIGKGVSARSVNLSFPPCTVVGATTRLGMLSKPLLSRFSGGVLRLTEYSAEEMVEIIRRSADALGIGIEEEATHILAERSRQTPRIANNLLKRARDVAEVAEKTVITKEIAQEAMGLCQIDELGLTEQDYNLLKTMYTTFKNGPAGLTALAMAAGEQEETIEEFFEPFLLRIGFIERTPRGRKMTEKACAHIKKQGLV